MMLDLVPDVVLADLTLDDGNASELLRLARRGGCQPASSS